MTAEFGYRESFPALLWLRLKSDIKTEIVGSLSLRGAMATKQSKTTQINKFTSSIRCFGEKLTEYMKLGWIKQIATTDEK